MSNQETSRFDTPSWISRPNRQTTSDGGKYSQKQKFKVDKKNFTSVGPTGQTIDPIRHCLTVNMHQPMKGTADFDHSSAHKAKQTDDTSIIASQLSKTEDELSQLAKLRNELATADSMQKPLDGVKLHIPVTSLDNHIKKVYFNDLPRSQTTHKNRNLKPTPLIKPAIRSISHMGARTRSTKNSRSRYIIQNAWDDPQKQAQDLTSEEDDQKQGIKRPKVEFKEWKAESSHYLRPFLMSQQSPQGSRDSRNNSRNKHNSDKSSLSPVAVQRDAQFMVRNIHQIQTAVNSTRSQSRSKIKLSNQVGTIRPRKTLNRGRSEVGPVPPNRRFSSHQRFPGNVQSTRQMRNDGSRINSPSQMMLTYDVSRQIDTINTEDNGRSSFLTHQFRAKTPQSNMNANQQHHFSGFLQHPKMREMSHHRKNIDKQHSTLKPAEQQAQFIKYRTTTDHDHLNARSISKPLSDESKSTNSAASNRSPNKQQQSRRSPQSTQTNLDLAQQLVNVLRNQPFYYQNTIQNLTINTTNPQAINITHAATNPSQNSSEQQMNSQTQIINGQPSKIPSQPSIHHQKSQNNKGYGVTKSSQTESLEKYPSPPQCKSNSSTPSLKSRENNLTPVIEQNQSNMFDNDELSTSQKKPIATAGDGKDLSVQRNLAVKQEPQNVQNGAMQDKQLNQEKMVADETKKAESLSSQHYSQDNDQRTESSGKNTKVTALTKKTDRNPLQVQETKISSTKPMLDEKVSAQHQQQQLVQEDVSPNRPESVHSKSESAKQTQLSGQDDTNVRLSPKHIVGDIDKKQLKSKKSDKKGGRTPSKTSSLSGSRSKIRPQSSFKASNGRKSEADTQLEIVRDPKLDKVESMQNINPTSELERKSCDSESREKLFIQIVSTQQHESSSQQQQTNTEVQNHLSPQSQNCRRNSGSNSSSAYSIGCKQNVDIHIEGTSASKSNVGSQAGSHDSIILSTPNMNLERSNKQSEKTPFSDLSDKDYTANSRNLHFQCTVQKLHQTPDKTSSVITKGLSKDLDNSCLTSSNLHTSSSNQSSAAASHQSPKNTTEMPATNTNLDYRHMVTGTTDKSALPQRLVTALLECSPPMTTEQEYDETPPSKVFQILRPQFIKFGSEIGFTSENSQTDQIVKQLEKTLRHVFKKNSEEEPVVQKDSLIRFNTNKSNGQSRFKGTTVSKNRRPLPYSFKRRMSTNDMKRMIRNKTFISDQGKNKPDILVKNLSEQSNDFTINAVAEQKEIESIHSSITTVKAALNRVRIYKEKERATLQLNVSQVSGRSYQSDKSVQTATQVSNEPPSPLEHVQGEADGRSSQDNHFFRSDGQAYLPIPRMSSSLRKLSEDLTPNFNTEAKKIDRENLVDGNKSEHGGDTPDIDNDFTRMMTENYFRDALGIEKQSSFPEIDEMHRKQRQNTLKVVRSHKLVNDDEKLKSEIDNFLQEGDKQLKMKFKRLKAAKVIVLGSRRKASEILDVHSNRTSSPKKGPLSEVISMKDRWRISRKFYIPTVRLDSLDFSNFKSGCITIETKMDDTFAMLLNFDQDFINYWRNIQFIKNPPIERYSVVNKIVQFHRQTDDNDEIKNIEEHLHHLVKQKFNEAEPKPLEGFQMHEYQALILPRRGSSGQAMSPAHRKISNLFPRKNLSRQNTNVKMRGDYHKLLSIQKSMAGKNIEFKYEQFFLENEVIEELSDNKSQKGGSKQKKQEDDRIDKSYLWYGQRFGDNAITQLKFNHNYLKGKDDYLKRIQIREEELYRKYDDGRKHQPIRFTSSMENIIGHKSPIRKSILKHIKVKVDVMRTPEKEEQPSEKDLQNQMERNKQSHDMNEYKVNSQKLDARTQVSRAFLELILKQNTNKAYLITVNEKVKQKIDNVKERGIAHYFDELSNLGMEEKLKQVQFTEEEQQKDFCIALEEYFATVKQEEAEQLAILLEIKSKSRKLKQAQVQTHYNRFQGYLTNAEVYTQFKLFFQTYVGPNPRGADPIPRDYKQSKITKGLLAYLQCRWNHDLFREVNKHFDFENRIREINIENSTKNRWLENNRYIHNRYRAVISNLAHKAMKPIQLLESKKSAVNYYVFDSCVNTLVSKRLYDDDIFAVKSLINKAYFSIWRAHTDEIIEQKKNKRIHFLELKRRESIWQPTSQFLEVGEINQDDNQSMLNGRISNENLSDNASDRSEEVFHEYKRQDAIRIRSLAENEEDDDIVEQTKDELAIKIFRKEDVERIFEHKSILTSSHREGELILKFGMRTCAIQNEQRTQLMEIYEPVQIPIDPSEAMKLFNQEKMNKVQERRKQQFKSSRTKTFFHKDNLILSQDELGLNPKANFGPLRMQKTNTNIMPWMGKMISQKFSKTEEESDSVIMLQDEIKNSSNGLSTDIDLINCDLHNIDEFVHNLTKKNKVKSNVKKLSKGATLRKLQKRWMTDAQYYQRLQQENNVKQNELLPVNDDSIMIMNTFGVADREIIEEVDEADSCQDFVEQIVKEAKAQQIKEDLEVLDEEESPEEEQLEADDGTYNSTATARDLRVPISQSKQDSTSGSMKRSGTVSTVNSGLRINPMITQISMIGQRMRGQSTQLASPGMKKRNSILFDLPVLHQNITALGRNRSIDRSNSPHRRRQLQQIYGRNLSFTSSISRKMPQPKMARGLTLPSSNSKESNNSNEKNAADKDNPISRLSVSDVKSPNTVTGATDFQAQATLAQEMQLIKMTQSYILKGGLSPLNSKTSVRTNSIPDEEKKEKPKNLVIKVNIENKPNTSSRRNAFGRIKSVSHEMKEDATANVMKGNEDNSLNIPQKNLEKSHSSIGIAGEKLQSNHKLQDSEKTDTSVIKTGDIIPVNTNTPPVTATMKDDSEYFQKDDSSFDIMKGSPSHHNQKLQAQDLNPEFDKMKISGSTSNINQMLQNVLDDEAKRSNLVQKGFEPKDDDEEDDSDIVSEDDSDEGDSSEYSSYNIEKQNIMDQVSSDFAVESSRNTSDGEFSNQLANMCENWRSDDEDDDEIQGPNVQTQANTYLKSCIYKGIKDVIDTSRQQQGKCHPYLVPSRFQTMRHNSLQKKITNGKNIKRLYMKKRRIQKLATQISIKLGKRKYYSTTDANIAQARLMIFNNSGEYFIKKMIDNIASGLDESLDRDGNTLLIMATRQGMHAVVEYLILKGASPDKQDAFGNTPLHYAFQFEFLYCRQVLIENGANEKIENKQGLRPIETAPVVWQ